MKELTKLRGPGEESLVKEEMNELAVEKEEMSSQSDVGWLDFYKNKVNINLIDLRPWLYLYLS